MKKLALIVFCCLTGIFASAQTHSFQVWTGLETSADISNKLSIDFEAEARFQQKSATFKQASAEIGVRYKLSKTLFTSVSYEFSSKYKKNGYFPINTLAATLGYKKKFGDFRFAIQSKLNVEKTSYIKNPEDVYPDLIDKNKVKISYNGLSRLKPSLFVETYHPIEAGSQFHVATVKYGANCTIEFRKHFELDLGYMFRHEVDENEYISILTLSVSKSF